VLARFWLASIGAFDQSDDPLTGTGAIGSPRRESSLGLSAGTARRHARQGQCRTHTRAHDRGSVNERPQSGSYVGRAEWSEAQRPSPAELLPEGVGHPASLQLLLMMLGTLVSGCALEGGVEPVAAVVDGPDRELVGNRARFHRKAFGNAHEVLIGATGFALEPADGTPTNYRPGGEASPALETLAVGSMATAR